MHSFRSRIVIAVVAAVMVGLVVGACSPSPSPSPSPATAPPASLSPTAAPMTGELPPDPGENPVSPPPAAGPTGSQIAVGAVHGCVITAQSRVECWGGRGDTPGLVSGIGAIAMGINHACALTNGGGVACWGSAYGIDSDLPMEVSGLSSGIVALAAGGEHTCLVTATGGVKCWGDGELGQLGHGLRQGSPIPVDVAGLAHGVTAVATGPNHTCALTSAGGATCWGNNHHGQLGDGTTDDTVVPIDVPSLSSGIEAIAVGGEHTCALTGAGAVKCWGNGEYGQLGTGSTKSAKVPMDVPGLTGVAAITAGDAHTCALLSTGSVKCWGYDFFGQIGDRSLANSSVPLDVPGLASRVTAVTAGGHTTCALADGGDVACWGNNMYHQLGNGTSCASSSVPVAVPHEPGAAPANEPVPVPTGTITHSKGAKDVLLRFDMTPDVGTGNMAGQIFQPGPEFTLYGDGRIIFRNDRPLATTDGNPYVRGRPFRVSRLSEKQVQSLLRFALGKGKLANACERYREEGAEDSTSASFTIRAGGFDKRVIVTGSPGPFEALADHLRDINQAGDLDTTLWKPDRYWGSLLPADALIKDGVLPAPSFIYDWPWARIAPARFSGLRELRPGRRMLSPKEATLDVGFLNDVNVVERAYLRGPDGETIYALSLWPVSPDEKS